MAVMVHAVGRADVPPIAMPDRFRTDVAYFQTAAGDPDVPRLGPGEYWIRQGDARRWLDEGVIQLVSPLSSSQPTEVELTEEQETWLTWLVEHGVEQIRFT